MTWIKAHIGEIIIVIIAIMLIPTFLGVLNLNCNKADDSKVRLEIQHSADSLSKIIELQNQHIIDTIAILMNERNQSVIDGLTEMNNALLKIKNIPLNVRNTLNHSREYLDSLSNEIIKKK